LQDIVLLFTSGLQKFKIQYLSKDGRTQAMMKVCLFTCCMSGDVSNKFFSTTNNVKQNDAPETVITPPVLRMQHKELGKN
jgi:hypothetical protein